MDTATNFIVGCILAACGLVVMFILSLDPSIRSAFIQDYISWMGNAIFFIFITAMILLALGRWK